jgi:glutamate-1-semialdehyde aminotransferase
VRVGGGIPTGVSMGREAVMQICKKDGVKFNERGLAPRTANV